MVAPREGHCKVDMLHFLLKSSASAFCDTKTRDYDFLGYAISSVILHFSFSRVRFTTTINDFSMKLEIPGVKSILQKCIYHSRLPIIIISDLFGHNG